MKLTTEKRQETGVGLMEDTEYTFENSGHMMQILSGLYANPDEAMVREYLTNMYDAHIALFKATGSWGPKPTLELPSSMTPMLIFADKGIGMSADSVKNIYTRYGKSTKSDSNEEVGGFGLGAKVAFAYNGGVDWTVESRFDGEKNTFIARIGKNGMPVLSHVGCEATTEHSGTTVSIPVRRQDVQRIQSAAVKYLRYFPLPIHVVNGEHQTNPRVIALEGEAWSISKGGNRYDGTINGIIAVVGNVPYEVMESELVQILQMASLQKSYFWRYNEFVLQIPVGSVDIVPSRDNLKYTDKTRITLANAMQVVAKEFSGQAAQIIGKAPTEYEALKMMSDFTDLQYVDDLLKEVDYKGKTIRRGTGIVRPVTDFPGSKFIGWGIVDGDKSEIVEIDTTKEVSLTIGPQTLLLIDDVPTGQVRVAKTLAHQRLVSKTAAGRARRWGGHHVGHVLVVTTKLTPAELSQKFGGYPADRIELASQHRKARAPAGLGINAENIYKFTGRSWGARVNVPKDGTVNYYLPLTKGQARFTYKDDSSAVERMLADAKAIGFITSDYRIFGIRSDEVATYDAKLWVNLETALAKEMVKKIKADGAKMARHQANRDYINGYAQKVKATKCIKGNKDVDMFNQTFAECAAAVDEMEPLWQTVRRYTNVPMVSAAIAALPKHTGPSLDALWTGLTVDYPMLTALVDVATGPAYRRVDDLMAQYRTQLEGYLKLVDDTP